MPARCWPPCGTSYPNGNDHRQDLREQQAPPALPYTPGVARVSRLIAQEPDAVWMLTTKRNAVAVVTDRSAILGLGNLRPAAALPVREGKAMLCKEFEGNG